MKYDYDTWLDKQVDLVYNSEEVSVDDWDTKELLDHINSCITDVSEIIEEALKCNYTNDLNAFLIEFIKNNDLDNKDYF